MGVKQPPDSTDFTFKNNYNYRTVQLISNLDGACKMTVHRAVWSRVVSKEPTNQVI